MSTHNVCFCGQIKKTTVELEWLEHLCDHRKLFKSLKVNHSARSEGK